MSSEKGLRCRQCNCADLRVIRTRPGTKSVTRVRQCRHCGKRMVTREKE